jgi:hypothetical protein
MFVTPATVGALATVPGQILLTLFQNLLHPPKRRLLLGVTEKDRVADYLEVALENPYGSKTHTSCLLGRASGEMATPEAEILLTLGCCTSQPSIGSRVECGDVRPGIK